MAGERRPGPGFLARPFSLSHRSYGFVGGWLAFWLARMGAQVTGYSLEPPTEPCFYHSLCGCRMGRRNDKRCLRSAARSRRRWSPPSPQVLLHLAAQPLVGVAFHEPYDTFTTNVLGTLNVLEAACAASSIEAVVVFTTDKVYAESDARPRFREDDPLGGTEPYALSKAGAEFAVRAYWEAGRAASILTVRW